MADITMPQLGETVTEGTITRWFKNVGDTVVEDEPLFEVSTDKVDSEVPSSASGVVSEILVPEGQTVDVGARLAVISSAGASATASASASATASAGASATAPAEPEPAAAPAPEPDPEPVAAAPEPVAAPAPAPQTAAPATSGLLLSPVVRRLVNEHGLDPATIPGTGQDGRITRADVLAFIDRNAGQAKAAPAPSPSAPPAAARPAPAPVAKPAPAAVPRAGGDDETIPFSNIRRRTAEHMIRSQATSAHVLVATEVDYSAVERVRLAAKEAFKAKEGVGLTYLPFIGRAVIDALDEFPHVNASVGNDELIVHRRVNLAIAVDLNFEGLIVPVVHDADQLRLPALARSFGDLARRARSRELTADDISGGTFTITNPGPFGTFLTFPVINQPQVAILSTDGIRKKPVAVVLPDGSDAVAVHPVGMLGLSFDHRAFDGAYASAFVGRVREILETRDWSEEL